MPWPIPVAPPVMRAVLPLREEMSYFSEKLILVPGCSGSRGPRCLPSAAILVVT